MILSCFIEKFDDEKLIDCPLPCEIDSYSGKSISKALFPTKHQAMYLKERMKNLPYIKKVNITDTTKFMRYIYYLVADSIMVFSHTFSQ